MNCLSHSSVSGQTLEVELNELTQGLTVSDWSRHCSLVPRRGGGRPSAPGNEAIGTVDS